MIEKIKMESSPAPRKNIFMLDEEHKDETEEVFDDQNGTKILQNEKGISSKVWPIIRRSPDICPKNRIFR